MSRVIERVESFRRRVTRERRAAIVLMIDASASMQGATVYEGRPLMQGEVAALSANSILRELVYKSKSCEGVRDYYDVMILVYNGDGVYSLFDNGKSHFRSITEIAKMGNGDTLLSLDVMTPFSSGDCKSKFALQPKGDTPMYEAFDFANEQLRAWVSRAENRASIPPFVVNLTDGHTTDSTLRDIVEIAARMRSISTLDGETLLLNLFLGETDAKLIFPTPEEVAACSDEFFRAMALSSSRVPAIFEPLVRELRGDDIAEVSPNGYYSVGFGISVEDMIAMMNIGTLVSVQ